MKLITEITIKDHFVDSARHSYSTLMGWLLPAIIVGINLMNEDSRNSLSEGAPISYIIYYGMIWGMINAIRIAIFVSMSLFGPLKNSRGTYETWIQDGVIYDKGPTNTRTISIGDIKSVKSDYKNGIDIKMNNGGNDGIFCRGNSRESIESFVSMIVGEINGRLPNK